MNYNGDVTKRCKDPQLIVRGFILKIVYSNSLYKQGALLRDVFMFTRTTYKLLYSPLVGAIWPGRKLYCMRGKADAWYQRVDQITFKAT